MKKKDDKIHAEDSQPVLDELLLKIPERAVFFFLFFLHSFILGSTHA